jgi:hypothetical protein
LGKQFNEVIDLSDTFLRAKPERVRNIIKEDKVKVTLPNKSKDGTNAVPQQQVNEETYVISRQKLIEEQYKDKELLDLFKIALTPEEAEKVSVGYLVKDNVLMRKWSPTGDDSEEKWKTVYQIVIPSVYRQYVIGLAHELPMSGHLGVGYIKCII